METVIRLVPIHKMLLECDFCISSNTLEQNTMAGYNNILKYHSSHIR
jgi:hypothetical protein